MALGIDANASWVAVSQRIEMGDTLLLYTDGIVEANNPNGEFYGVERLLEVTEQVANWPSQWIIRAVQENVLDFQEGMPQSDDITPICVNHKINQV